MWGPLHKEESKSVIYTIWGESHTPLLDPVLNYRQPILDLQPDLESQYVYGGCILVFRFVRGDGVWSQFSDFISIIWTVLLHVNMKLS